MSCRLLPVFPLANFALDAVPIRAAVGKPNRLFIIIDDLNDRVVFSAFC